ncbi:MAG: hypothetical protein ABIP19_00595 [Dermatophilaceae bacterium]
MSILSQATDVFMAALIWVLPVVGVVAVIGIALRIAVIRARKARKAKSAEHEHAVLTWCVAHGHAYAVHGSGLQCGVCGNYVARRDGELYGAPEEGRVDRRRVDRHAAA